MRSQTVPAAPRVARDERHADDHDRPVEPVGPAADVGPVLIDHAVDPEPQQVPDAGSTPSARRTAPRPCPRCRPATTPGCGPRHEPTREHRRVAGTGEPVHSSVDVLAVGQRDPQQHAAARSAPSRRPRTYRTQALTTDPTVAAPNVTQNDISPCDARQPANGSTTSLGMTGTRCRWRAAARRRTARTPQRVAPPSRRDQ